MRRFKKLILDGKTNYILANIFFVCVSVIISWLLEKNGEISSTGAYILGIFQLITFNTLWLVIEIKFRIEERDKSKNVTDTVLDNFEESNLLRTKLVDTLTSDLNFDRQVKKDFKHLKNAHMFLSNLKIKTYFREFFIFNTDNQTLSDVPSAYFEKKIWKRLVNDSDFYFSIQNLSNNQLSYYLENKDRLREETSTLQNKITGSNNTKLKKVFIVNDNHINSKNNQLICCDDEENQCDICDYLRTWYDKFSDNKYNGAFPMKIAKESTSLGHISDDIGIFGNILFGIQRIRNEDEKKIMREDLKIDFYFNSTEVEAKIHEFNEFFDDSMLLSLNEVFSSDST